MSQEVNVVWKPFPGSQSLAIDSRADHTLYHGTRGPGKTDTQLMRFRRKVGLGYGAFWNGIIFDLEFDNLKGLVAIGSALIMAYVLFSSFRRVQSAEVAADGKIQDAQNRADLAEEVAATEVVARDLAHQEAKEKLVKAVNAREEVANSSDDSVREQLSEKWTRD